MISQLQYITPNLTGSQLHELVEKVCAAGVDWVQLRLKDISAENYLEEAKALRTITNKFSAKLIINDNIEVAIESEADGVHLGKEDLSTKIAREKVGNQFIIGGTANTLDDIKNHINNKVDYIGLGPFRFTTTKENLSPELGLTGYQKLLDVVGKATPVVGIGGITPEDIMSLLNTGLHGVAISGAITNSENPDESALRFIEEIEEHHKELIK